MNYRPLILTVLFSLIFVYSANAQVSENNTWKKHLSKKYTEHKDIVYKKSASSEQKLNLYTLNENTEKRPLFVFFHGGGWRKGTKDSTTGQLMAFMKNNWVTANVDYRLLGEASAPAAVIDCRCALYWLVSHADEYGIDKNKIVVGGTSAGGHLALMTGLLPNDHAYNDSCGPVPEFKIAAVLNFYGITDVADILTGANKRGFGRDWLGDQPDREGVAKAVSPVTYVKPGIPPVFTVHGDADPTVPYSQAEKLNKVLLEAGIEHKFITIPGGLHGKFDKEQMKNIYLEMENFFKKLEIPFSSE